jgi:glycerophosphoryl diester phosphodiesterase
MKKGALAALTAAAALLFPGAAAAQQPVLEEHFDGSALPAGWRAVEGEWSVSGGRLVGRSSSAAQLSRITFGPRLDNYRVELTLRFESVADAARWTAIALDMAPDGAPPWWHAALRSGSLATNGVEFAERTAGNTWNVTERGAAPTEAGTGRDVEVAVEVRGNRAYWLYEGQQVLRTRAIRRSADGRLGLLVNGATVTFDDVVVTEIEPEPLVLPDDEETVPRVVAHRGYSSVTPENTLAAYAAGARSGADWVEIDVATSADGVPYVLHDNTVDRTTPGTGALPALQSSYLDGLEAGSWFTPAFGEQPLPRFDPMLDEVLRGPADLLLEIKGPETPAELERIIGMVRAKGLIGRTLLQSFDEQVLRDSRAIAPDLRLGLLRGALDADPVATSQALDVVAYNPSWAAIRGRDEMIDRLNEAGVAVMPYTVDDAAEWPVMRDAGVDAVITNKPGALVGWNARYEQAGNPTPARAEVLSPAPDAELERDDDVSVAVDVGGAREVAITLDGEPVEEGAHVPVDELALGEHAIAVEADSETAESRFHVVASAAGLAHVVATAGRFDDQLRLQLLRAVLDRDWGRVIGLAERNERALGRRLSRLIPRGPRPPGAAPPPGRFDITGTVDRW